MGRSLKCPHLDTEWAWLQQLAGIIRGAGKGTAERTPRHKLRWHQQSYNLTLQLGLEQVACGRKG